MQLLINNHTQVANKWLILFSGFNKNAVNINGEKVYEKHYFHLPEQWTSIKWSKNMIKQVLAYLGLANSQGDLGIVGLEELAELLHCSVRSLQNNNKLFVELGLIDVEELYGDLAHIQLTNYLSNFLDLQKKSPFPEDGDEYISRTGYTTIKREALLNLFEIKNVNVLRIACRAFFLHEKEVNLGNNDSILMTSNTLKGFLPVYFSYRPVIERAIRPLAGLFDMEFFNVGKDKDELLSKHKATASIIDKFKAPYMISMKLHKGKDSRLVAQEENTDFVLSSLWAKLGNTIGLATTDHLNASSLSELAYEYGQQPVRKAITDITAWFENRFEDVSETSLSLVKEFKEFRWSNQPIGILRNIFKKYALSSQEGYLFKF